MRVSDVVCLNLWPHDACKELWHSRTRIVLKGDSARLIFSHKPLEDVLIEVMFNAIVAV